MYATAPQPVAFPVRSTSVSAGDVTPHDISSIPNQTIGSLLSHAMGPVLALALACASTVTAQEVPQVFSGAKIFPVEGEPIESGVLVVRDGAIVAVGPSDGTPIPDGAERHDVTGKVIIPGLVCTHSHVGRIEGADASGPLQPDIRIYDSIDVGEPGFRRALAGGLTALNIMPGSGHLMSGQTIYLKLRGGDTIEDYLLRDSSGKPLGGMKMANGTNSRGDPPFPGTRGKAAALVRQKFIAAKEYGEKIARAGDDGEKLPPRDIGLEAMLEVLQGRRVVHHHTHRHDDVVTVLRLAKEFGFRVVLHHVSEGWKVVDEIAAANAPCSLILLDSPGGKLEAVDIVFRTGALLEKAGVPVAFHTDDPITDSRLFLRMPAMAVRAGMSRAAALRSVTLVGAEMLGLEERIGSLKTGKDADFVVLSGDPFSVYTKVLQTWVEGKRAFDRSREDDRHFAVGGVGAGSRARRHAACCLQEDPR